VREVTAAAAAAAAGQWRTFIATCKPQMAGVTTECDDKNFDD